MSENKVTFCFKIDADLLQKFRIACAYHKVKYGPYLIDAIKDLIESTPELQKKGD